MKKIIAIAIAIAIASVLFFTHIAHAQMNTSLYIREIAYKRNGNIKLEFGDNTIKKVAVSWTGREILNVSDKTGREIPAEIISHGVNWLTIYTYDIVEGETYTFDLKRVSHGVRNDIAYTGFFVAEPGWTIEYHEPVRYRKQLIQPGAALTKDVFISEIKYNRGGDLDIKFAGVKGKEICLEWSGGETIAVRDETGAVYDARIKEYGDNEIEVKISGIVENMNCIIEISNVPYGDQSLSFKAPFTARNDWKYRPLRTENRQ